MHSLRWLDPLIILIYLVALVSIGIAFSRRQTSTERYFVAKRSIPGWAMGLSLLATLISSVTFIAYPGSAYAGDWSNLVPGLMVVPVLAIIATIIIPFFRHAVRMSAYEYFGRRFGYAAGLWLGGLRARSLFEDGLRLLPAGSHRHQHDGLEHGPRHYPGGRHHRALYAHRRNRSRIWADVVQGFLLWFGILISLGYLLLLPPGGPSVALATAWNSHKISLGSTAPVLSKPTILVLALYGFFYYLQRYTADQTVVQRYLVARSDKAAIRGLPSAHCSVCPSGLCSC